MKENNVISTIAKLETRTSKEGKSYQVLVIKLSNDYEKLVFLNKAEIEILKLHCK